MYGHRASSLASCAASRGGLPRLTRQAGPGNAFLSPCARRCEQLGVGCRVVLLVCDVVGPGGLVSLVVDVLHCDVGHEAGGVCAVLGRRFGVP